MICFLMEAAVVRFFSTIYRRKENGLAARIEGTIDGKEQSMEWEWKRPAAESVAVDELPPRK